MILLDTNQLQPHLALDTPTVSILRAIARSSSQRLALPTLVADEFMAEYERHVQRLRGGIRRQVEDLRRLDRASQIEVMNMSPIEAITAQHRALLELTFELLAVPVGAAELALQRELSRQLPASTSWDKPGSGARDVAIWLTSLHQMRDDDEIYFISNDKAAFGPGATLHAELGAEVDAMPGTLHYFNSIDQLLGVFAREEPVDPDSFGWVTCDTTVRQALESLLYRPLPPTTTYDAMRTMSSIWAYSGLAVDSGVIEQARLYWLQNSAWLSLRVIWHGTKTQWTGYANMPTFGPSARTVVSHYRVPTTLLIELAGDRSIIAAQVDSLGQERFVHSEVFESD